MTCIGICQRHKFASSKSKGVYRRGGKYCRKCDLFISPIQNTDFVNCICCGHVLRTKARNRFRG